jgi:hypothetical protein
MLRARPALLFLLLLAACSSGERKRAPLTPRDAGAVMDATPLFPDATTDQPDATTGFPDATTGFPDASEPPDAGGDMCTGGPMKREPIRSDVVNGTRSPTYVPLDSEQIMAVVGITEGTPVDAVCSGTLIADRVVLTAQHCTEGVSAASMWILFGVDDQAPDLAIEVTAKHEHPSHDMALLELASSPSAQIAVRPIYIPLFDLTTADFGRTLEQAGYGQTSISGGTDGRFFVAEVLDDFEEANDRNLVVNGQGQHGVCFGDSGGPSLAIAPEGDVRVMGALSWGDDSCVGRDRYARTDFARTWIEQYTGPTPGAGPQPCGSVTSVGNCFQRGSQVTYCDNGVLKVDDCTSGEVCGWSNGDAGWRCLPLAQDPCGGIGFYGRCDSEVLSWCDRGVVQRRDCGACGEECVEIDNAVGFNCRVNECGDLDYLGRCNGNVAEWCTREGMIETLDCAAQGDTCGWIDNEIGYYCR